jgi:large subunit ribosomal protein L24e
MYVKKTGKILYFCSRKCEKNMIKLGREPRYAEWVRKKRK